jgi:hypothetical protein
MWVIIWATISVGVLFLLLRILDAGLVSIVVKEK